MFFFVFFSYFIINYPSFLLFDVYFLSLLFQLFLLEVFCQDAKGQESLFGSCYLPSSEMGEPRQVVAITTDKQGVPVGEISGMF